MSYETGDPRHEHGAESNEERCRRKIAMFLQTMAFAYGNEPAAAYNQESIRRKALAQYYRDNIERFMRFRGTKPDEWLELRILGAQVSETFKATMACHIDSEANIEAALKLADERWRGTGCYYVLNAIRPEVRLAAGAINQWSQLPKGAGANDEYVTARRVVPLDFDPVRPVRGINATAEESQYAIDAAIRGYAQLSEDLGGDECLGFGFSGNGAQAYIALDDLPNTPELTSTIHELLVTARHVYESAHVEFDTKVGNPSRLGPAWGTMKRKSAEAPERPWRRTLFWCEPDVKRLPQAKLEALLALWRSRLTGEQQADVDKTLHRAPVPSPGKRSPTDSPQPAPGTSPVPSPASVPSPGAGGPSSPFTICNDVPGASVASWLGLLHDDSTLTCPGCGTVGSAADTSVVLLEHGLKCSHNRCDQKGRDGFRTNVDLVMEVRGVSPIEACRLMDSEFKLGIRWSKNGTGNANGTMNVDPGDDRPVVQLSTHLADNVDAVMLALARDTDIYQRSRGLVHVVGTKATDTGLFLEGTPQIREMQAATLRERLTRVVRFEKYNEKKKGWVGALPSEAVVQALLARGDYPGIRPLVGIIEAPSMRPDGSIIQTPGYDKTTGYLYVPSGEFPLVPENPSHADAMLALDDLLEPFSEFPFAGPEHQASAIAGAMTIVARPAIKGSVPAVVHDANVRGSGKTLKADVVCIIGTGRATAKMTWPKTEEELEKILGAYGLRGARVISFDNLVAPFGGAPLDRCLTAGEGDSVELRVLGKSEVPAVPWGAVVMATGNNVAISGDTARRMLVSRLESPLENPEERQQFTHPNLLAWVKENRPRLVVAVLTILRAWHVAGRPSGGCKPWGSFECWSAMIPPAIVFAGGADPMLTRPTVSGEQDVEKLGLLAILDGLACMDPKSAGVSAKVILAKLYPLEHGQAASAADDGLEGMREAIESLTTLAPGRCPSPKQLGYLLKRFRRRVVGGRQIDNTNDRKGVARWRVSGVGLQSAGDAGHAGDVSSANPVFRPSSGTDSGAKTGGDGQSIPGIAGIPGTNPPKPPAGQSASLDHDREGGERNHPAPVHHSAAPSSPPPPSDCVHDAPVPPDLDRNRPVWDTPGIGHEAWMAMPPSLRAALAHDRPPWDKQGISREAWMAKEASSPMGEGARGQQDQQEAALPILDKKARAKERKRRLQQIGMETYTEMVKQRVEALAARCQTEPRDAVLRDEATDRPVDRDAKKYLRDHLAEHDRPAGGR